jgi:hypothetical protein
MTNLLPFRFSVTVALCLILLVPAHSLAQSDSSAVPAATVPAAVADNLQKDLDVFLDRQSDVVDMHKRFAFLSAGFLLLGDALGTYQFFHLRSLGHDYCRSHSNGAESDSIDPAVFRAGIAQAWGDPQSQLFRVLHGGSITMGTICYTATATMELTMPRISKDKRPLSAVNVHHGLFYLHAGLMVANIGLGFLESYALSRGNHDLVIGAGTAHMVIGFALPVVMTASGLVYKLHL